MNIIVDLDGTLAIDVVRAQKHLHLKCYDCSGTGSVVELTSGEREGCDTCRGSGKYHQWDEYFDACDGDTINVAILEIMSRFSRDHKIFILSGRSDVVRDKTVKWLSDHGVPYDALCMRPAENRAQDNLLKLEWARTLGLTPENTLFILEDRQRVVDAWRLAGYFCLQTAPGNF